MSEYNILLFERSRELPTVPVIARNENACPELVEGKQSQIHIIVRVNAVNRELPCYPACPVRYAVSNRGHSPVKLGNPASFYNQCRMSRPATFSEVV